MNRMSMVLSFTLVVVQITCDVEVTMAVEDDNGIEEVTVEEGDYGIEEEAGEGGDIKDELNLRFFLERLKPEEVVKLEELIHISKEGSGKIRSEQEITRHSKYEEAIDTEDFLNKLGLDRIDFEEIKALSAMLMDDDVKEMDGAKTEDEAMIEVMKGMNSQDLDALIHNIEDKLMTREDEKIIQVEAIMDEMGDEELEMVIKNIEDQQLGEMLTAIDDKAFDGVIENLDQEISGEIKMARNIVKKIKSEELKETTKEKLRQHAQLISNRRKKRDLSIISEENEFEMNSHPQTEPIKIDLQVPPSQDLISVIKAQQELVAVVLDQEKENRRRKKRQEEVIYKEPTFYAHDFEPVEKSEEEKKSAEYLGLLSLYEHSRKRVKVADRQRNYDSSYNNYEKERKKRHLNFDWLFGYQHQEDSDGVAVDNHELMLDWPVKYMSSDSELEPHSDPETTYHVEPEPSMSIITEPESFMWTSFREKRESENSQPQRGMSSVSTKLNSVIARLSVDTKPHPYRLSIKEKSQLNRGSVNEELNLNRRSLIEEAEAEPKFRRKRSLTEDAEAEPEFRQKRSFTEEAEAEPEYRQKRSFTEEAEPEFRQKRSFTEEAEPEFRQKRSFTEEAEPEPEFRQKRSFTEEAEPEPEFRRKRSFTEEAEPEFRRKRSFTEEAEVKPELRQKRSFTEEAEPEFRQKRYFAEEAEAEPEFRQKRSFAEQTKPEFRRKRSFAEEAEPEFRPKRSFAEEAEAEPEFKRKRSYYENDYDEPLPEF